MSNCTGCHHSFGEEPNPHAEECEICIRNPKYPTMKMPEKATIDGVEVTVPQDMYISKDRKTYEEKVFLRKLAKIMGNLRPNPKPKDPSYPLPYIPKKERPWENYWDYVHYYQKKKRLFIR